MGVRFPEYSSKRFFTLASLALLVPSGILYGAWASVTHNFPYCGDRSTSFSYLQMSVENLTRNSEIISIGTVERVGSSWEAPNSEVFTDITMRVTEYLKNNQSSGAETQLQFQVAGGTIGCYSYIVSGEPGFSDGEHALLFLRPEQYGTLRLTGGSQGKYVITGNTAYWGDPRNALALDDLKAQIKQYL